MGEWHPVVMMCSETPAVEAAEAGHTVMSDWVGGLERGHSKFPCVTGVSGEEES